MFVLLCRLVEDHGRDHLDGLAETHVVRKDAALVPGVVFLVDHPADTNDLVREEADFHAGEVVLQAEERESDEFLEPCNCGRGHMRLSGRKRRFFWSPV